MERDFLGIGEQNSGALVKENCGSRLHTAFSVGSNVQWPFANKASAMQKFISFETLQDDKHRKLLFNPLSSTGLQHIPLVDAFEATQKACFVQPSQKSFSMEGQGVIQFPTHAYQNQNMNTNLAFTHHLNGTRFATVSHASFPIALSSSISLNPTVTEVKQQPFGSVMADTTSSLQTGRGNLTPRNVDKLSTTSAQLTIFYAGSVNVYDNVASDAAQAIMLMASKESNTAVKAVNLRTGAPVLPLSKGSVSDGQNITQTLNNMNHAAYSCSSHSRTVSFDSHTESGCGPALTDDKGGANVIGTMMSPSQNKPSSKTVNASMGASTASTIMSRAVPQARKASLARFLEKRKERVSNIMPYSCEKIPSENSIALEGAAPSSKCSSAISSNQGGSLCVGQTKTKS